MARRLGLTAQSELAAYIATKLIIARLGVFRLSATLHQEGIHPDQYARRRKGWYSRFAEALSKGELHYDFAITRDISVLNQSGSVLGTPGAVSDGRFGGLVPPVSRLLADYLYPSTRRYVEMIEEGAPLWYIRDGDNWLRTENFLILPLVPGRIFQARASILHENPSVLERYVDQPVCPGDPLYIRNLTAVMLSYAGVSWKKMDRSVAIQGPPEPLRLSLVGRWLFKLDPRAQGPKQKWYLPSLSTSDWNTIRVPATWEESGYLGIPNGSVNDRYPSLKLTSQSSFNGIGRYRRDFYLGPEFAKRKLTLVIGRIDDFDWTYINGMLKGLLGSSQGILH